MSDRSFCNDFSCFAIDQYSFSTSFGFFFTEYCGGDSLREALPTCFGEGRSVRAEVLLVGARGAIDQSSAVKHRVAAAVRFFFEGD